MFGRGKEQQPKLPEQAEAQAGSQNPYEWFNNPAFAKFIERHQDFDTRDQEALRSKIEVFQHLDKASKELKAFFREEITKDLPELKSVLGEDKMDSIDEYLTKRLKDKSPADAKTEVEAILAPLNTYREKQKEVEIKSKPVIELQIELDTKRDVLERMISLQANETRAARGMGWLGARRAVGEYRERTAAEKAQIIAEARALKMKPTIDDMKGAVKKVQDKLTDANTAKTDVELQALATREQIMSEFRTESQVFEFAKQKLDEYMTGQLKAKDANLEALLERQEQLLEGPTFEQTKDGSIGRKTSPDYSRYLADRAAGRERKESLAEAVEGQIRNEIDAAVKTVEGSERNAYNKMRDVLSKYFDKKRIGRFKKENITGDDQVKEFVASTLGPIHQGMKPDDPRRMLLDAVCGEQKINIKDYHNAEIEAPEEEEAEAAKADAADEREAAPPPEPEVPGPVPAPEIAAPAEQAPVPLEGEAGSAAPPVSEPDPAAPATAPSAGPGAAAVPDSSGTPGPIPLEVGRADEPIAPPEPEPAENPSAKIDLEPAGDGYHTAGSAEGEIGSASHAPSPAVNQISPEDAQKAYYDPSNLNNVV